MRIYSNPLEAIREIERDLWEMSINVHPQTMQDKVVADDPEYDTKEIRGYAYAITDWPFNQDDLSKLIRYTALNPTDDTARWHYAQAEFHDRVCGEPRNPGFSYLHRRDVWDQFLHDGKFSYTYSERMTPQLYKVWHELRDRPDTRQAIINIHSNICPLSSYVTHERVPPDRVWGSADLENTGGNARIPCSMYYQLMRREGKLDLIYTMRSCDFLTHFAIDVSLALMLQQWMANQLEIGTGRFTHFIGSLHAYHKDLKSRNIF